MYVEAPYIYGNLKSRMVNCGMVVVFMKKVKAWLNSIAGRVGVVLTALSVLLIAVGYSDFGSGYLSQREADNANNLLFGLATNLFGLVITVSIVQVIFDRQDEKRAKLKEKNKF